MNDLVILLTQGIGEVLTRSTRVTRHMTEVEQGVANKTSASLALNVPELVPRGGGFKGEWLISEIDF